MTAYLDKSNPAIEWETDQDDNQARLDPSAMGILSTMRYDEIIDLMSKYPTPMSRLSQNDTQGIEI